MKFSRAAYFFLHISKSGLEYLDTAGNMGIEIGNRANSRDLLTSDHEAQQGLLVQRGETGASSRKAPPSSSFHLHHNRRIQSLKGAVKGAPDQQLANCLN